MIGPGILLIASHLVVALFFNHESPIYYAVKARETTDPAKKQKYQEEEGRLLATFFADSNEIKREKSKLEDISDQL
jgi:hypothetical protein